MWQLFWSCDFVCAPTAKWRLEVTVRPITYCQFTVFHHLIEVEKVMMMMMFRTWTWTILWAACRSRRTRRAATMQGFSGYRVRYDQSVESASFRWRIWDGWTPECTVLQTFKCSIFAFRLHFVCDSFAFRLHFVCVSFAFRLRFVCVLFAFYLRFVCQF
jgi:hypothetical protein